MIRSVNGEKKCLNIYDVRLEDDFPACGMNWPPDLRDIAPYLGVRPQRSHFLTSLLSCVRMLTFVA